MGYMGYKLENMIPTPAGTATPRALLTSEDGILLAYGTSVPGAVAGYAIGCRFIKTNGSEGTTFYVNEGTATEANFDAVLVTTDEVITQAMIKGDAIDGTKIADDAIDSEHYTDGSIDNAHLANGAVNSEECDETLIQTKSITLSTAQIKALGTAYDLVAAPGAHKAIEFISAYLFLNYSGGALSAVTGNIRTGEMNQGAFANTFISAEADRVVISHCGAGNDDADTYFIDTSLNIKLDSNPTGAESTSTLTIVVSYRVHTFS